MLLLGACGGDTGNRSASEEAATIYGFWDLVELDGERPRHQPTITFTLDPSLNNDQAGTEYLTFSGFDGCNGFDGAFAVTANKLEIASMFSSVMSCGTEAEDQADRIHGALRDSEWSIREGQLTLVGGDGSMAVLEEMETDGAVGVWTLMEIDGQTVRTTISLTMFPGGSYSGYAGCSIAGTYEGAGDRLVMSGATPMASVTTTVPAPPATPDPAHQEPVPPLFGCEAVSDQERQFLTLLGVTTGDVVPGEMV